jgi:hypothetical protein
MASDFRFSKRTKGDSLLLPDLEDQSLTQPDICFLPSLGHAPPKPPANENNDNVVMLCSVRNSRLFMMESWKNYRCAMFPPYITARHHQLHVVMLEYGEACSS